MKRREKGLTLIELMVTLAVAIVLLAIGIPAFNAMSARDMSAATVNSLVTALQQARVEAISLNDGVRVCGRQLSNPCNPAAVVDPGCDETNWRCGWAVVRAVTPTVPLKLFPAPRTQTSTSGIPAGGFLEFGGLGQRTVPDPTTAVTFLVTANSEGKCVRATNVIVTGVGQIRSENRACP